MRVWRLIVTLPALITLAACKNVEPPQATPTTAPIGLEPFAVSWDDRSYQDQAWLPSSYDSAIDLTSANQYRMEVFIASDFKTVSGRQQIRYTNNEAVALDEVYLRLFPNLAGGDARVTLVTIDGQAVEPVYEAQNSSVKLSLEGELGPGESIVLELEFSTTIPRRMEGNYGLFGYFDGFLVLDTFYPMIPAYDAEGWQKEATPPNGDPTYNDISFYLVQVHAPAGLTLMATGSEVDRIERDGQQVVVYASGPARDFYIAAAEGLEVVQEQVDDTLVCSYAPAGFREHAELVLSAGVNALQSFEERFGPYPYPEMELTGTPMRALGIEYPGIMGMNLDLYDPEGSIGGVPAAVYLESTVAHEVSHQWFYNIVGNDQVEQPWLDEALAQYATYLYFLDTYGVEAAAAFEQSWYDRWDRTDRADIPIGLPAGEYQGAEYSGIVYGRGPIFIAELSRKMGQDVLDLFLRQYVQQHAWGIATAGDFEAAAEAACGCILDDFLADWVGSSN